MFSWLRRPREKYSLENLKFLYEQLLRYPDVNTTNKDAVVEILRSIAELMIWGDQHNDNFFYFFCEKNILSHFLRILSQRVDRQVNIQLLQTLSIMIANFSKQTSMYYLLSNNHINDLIVHRFDFSDEEVLAYYISFLKTLSLKLDGSTLQFFFNERLNDFPLYTQAVQFFHHSEAMVRIAVRTLTLNVYRVDDPTLRKFILNKSAVPYFCNLVWFIRDQLVEIDRLFREDPVSNRLLILKQVDEQIDAFHYIMEILRLGIAELSEVLADQILAHFVLPVLIGSLPNAGSDDSCTHTPMILPHLALFVLTQVFVVFTDRPLVNSVITCLLHDHPPSFVGHLISQPPEHPVFDSIALTSVLYRPKLRKSAFSTVFADASTPSTPSKNAHNQESGAQETPSSSPGRSAPTGIGPVFQPSGLPNWDEKSPNNCIRDRFMSCLKHPDVRIAFGACSVLMAIVKNVESDSVLLADVSACPQRQLKRRRLLDKLLSADESTPSSRSLSRLQTPRRGSVPIAKKQSSEVPCEPPTPTSQPQNDTVLPQKAHRSPPAKAPQPEPSSSESPSPKAPSVEPAHDSTESKEVSHECHSGDDAATISADPLLASEAPLYVVPSRRVVTSGVPDSDSPTPSTPSFQPSASAACLGELADDTSPSKSARSRLDELSECLQTSQRETDLHYADKIVEILIGVLEQRPARSKLLLCLVAHLIGELVLFEPSQAHVRKSCLKKHHLKRVREALAASEDDVRSTQAFSEFVAAVEEMSQSPFGSLFIDVFESEYIAFPTPHDMNRAIEDPEIMFVRTESSAPENDSDIGSSDVSTVDLGTVLSSAVQVPLNACLALSRLYKRVQYEKEGVAPVQRPHELAIKKRDIIDTSRRQLLSCVAMFGPVRERKLLLVDDEFLLLADPAASSEYHQNANVHCAIPLRHIEVSLNPSDALCLNVVYRGDVTVHSECRFTKTASGRRVTFFALKMTTDEDAKKALAFLIRHRAKRRNQFLRRVHLFLHTPD